jgi:NAD-dependent oxidoreductase involved in siderophore biosynthesis
MVVRQGCQFNLNLFTAHVSYVREIIQDNRDKYSNQSTNCIIISYNIRR